MRSDWTGMGTGDGAFPLTRLTLIRQASQASPEERKEVLDHFWKSYWKPLYAYARNMGAGNEEAKDLVQAFCAKSIETGLLARFDPSRGRLRTWMLTTFRSFFLDETDKARAEMRGGGKRALPEEAALGVPDPAQAEFDRAWAHGLIERAFDRWKRDLGASVEDRWKLDLVALIHSDGYGKLPELASLATRLGVTVAQVRHFVQRDSKKRLREEILLEVREGASGEAEAREELDYLLRCVAQP